MCYSLLGIWLLKQPSLHHKIRTHAIYMYLVFWIAPRGRLPKLDSQLGSGEKTQKINTSSNEFYLPRQDLCFPPSLTFSDYNTALLKAVLGKPDASLERNRWNFSFVQLSPSIFNLNFQFFAAHCMQVARGHSKPAAAGTDGEAKKREGGGKKKGDRGWGEIGDKAPKVTLFTHRMLSPSALSLKPPSHCRLSIVGGRPVICLAGAQNCIAGSSPELLSPFIPSLPSTSARAFIGLLTRLISKHVSLPSRMRRSLSPAIASQAEWHAAAATPTFSECNRQRCLCAAVVSDCATITASANSSTWAVQR